MSYPALEEFKRRYEITEETRQTPRWGKKFYYHPMRYALPYLHIEGRMVQYEPDPPLTEIIHKSYYFLYGFENETAHLQSIRGQYR
jgi:hypothetical protein